MAKIIKAGIPVKQLATFRHIAHFKENLRQLWILCRGYCSFCIYSIQQQGSNQSEADDRQAFTRLCNRHVYSCTWQDQEDDSERG